MAKRLRDVCKLCEDENLWRAGRGFVVCDLPWTIDKLRQLPPFEFENWAVIALGGIPNKVQVGDMGIDGRAGARAATARSPVYVAHGGTTLRARWTVESRTPSPLSARWAMVSSTPSASARSRVAARIRPVRSPAATVSLAAARGSD